MRYVAAAFIFLLASCGTYPAFAQVAQPLGCLKIEQSLQVIKDGKFSPISAGQAQEGNVVVYANPDGAWMVLVQMPEIHCLIAAGEKYVGPGPGRSI